MADVSLFGLGAIGALGLIIAARHSIRVIIECFHGFKARSPVSSILNLEEPKLAALLLHGALLLGMVGAAALLATQALWGA